MLHEFDAVLWRSYQVRSRQVETAWASVCGQNIHSVFTPPKPRHIRQPRRTVAGVQLSSYEPRMVGKHIESWRAPAAPPTISSEEMRRLTEIRRISTFRSLEAGLGKVMSKVETAPVALGPTTTTAEVAAHKKLTDGFDEKNGNLCTRLLLVTSDCADGYANVASQDVQTYGPIGTGEFVDGRSAIVLNQANFGPDWVYRMQEFHEKFGSLEVYAVGNSDSAGVIQELRRICIELNPLGDTVVRLGRLTLF